MYRDVLPVVNKNDIPHHMQPFDRLSMQFHSLRCCKANPLVCPMLQGILRIISFIEDASHPPYPYASGTLDKPVKAATCLCDARRQAKNP